MSSDDRQRRVVQLRQQALDRLQARHGRLSDIPADRIEELFHELEVHQVELEVQNEELRRTEVALAEALERYQDLYDRAPVSYLTLDSEGRIVQSNQAAARLSGRDHDELEGLNALELVQYDDRPRVLEFLQRAAATGVPLGSEFRIARRGGGRRWVHGEISRLARRDKPGFRLMLVDITARVLADESLRESEARFRLASAAGATLVYELDVADRGAMIAYGLERVTGYDSHQDMSGAWWASLVHSDDVVAYREHLDALTANGSNHLAVYRIRREDGTWITVEDHAQVPHDPARAGRRIIGTISDITERRQAEDALLDAGRRKDEFLATLAHELRNPLAPIRNAVGVLRASGPTASDLRWARDVIERQTDQMSRLVDDLLDVSRITRGTIDLRKEPVELRRVIADAVEAAQPLIDASGHALSVDIPDGLIAVNADPVRITQVVLNLLGNAVKFTPRNGTIGITVRRDGPNTVIRVTDNGVGIDADLLPHVFDMFAQGEHDGERTRTGLGIGLTLVKRLVELHGGTIEASSPGPGRGSEFVVRLPIAHLDAGPESDAEPAPVRHAGPRRILVVDDNHDSAESMARFLRLDGNDVHTAHDGLEALERLDEVAPDVVLLDIGLPGRNGYDVAREVRERRGDGVLLIAMTGWGQDEDRRRSKEAGFDHHLVKPVDLDRLTSLLGDASAHA